MQQGFVNYYIDEPEENYVVVRNKDDVDTFKCQFQKTVIDLIDPVQKDIELDFKSKGVKLVDHKSNVEFGEELTEDINNQYDIELEALLKKELDHVSEVIVFHHNMRTSKGSDARKANPSTQVHSDFLFDTAIAQVEKILGTLWNFFKLHYTVVSGPERSQEWFKDNGHVGIVNVWRPVGNPVEKTPLAVMDIDTIQEDDKVKVSQQTYSPGILFSF